MMRKSERHRLIADRLMADSFVSVEQMAAMIGTSLVTIRRDFGELAEAGKLRRVHGGAEPAGETRHVFVGRSFERNQHRNVAAKRRIAKAAASLCGDGEAVIIDGGTTTHQMSSLLAGRGMQVLTNSLHIVQSLITDASTRLLVPGGGGVPSAEHHSFHIGQRRAFGLSRKVHVHGGRGRLRGWHQAIRFPARALGAAVDRPCRQARGAR